MVSSNLEVIFIVFFMSFLMLIGVFCVMIVWFKLFLVLFIMMVFRFVFRGVNSLVLRLLWLCFIKKMLLGLNRIFLLVWEFLVEILRFL